MKIFTIGFTQKSAARFFELLRAAGVKRLLDVRLNNVSQLAGFTKRGDLEYFCREILGIDYVHRPVLAPTQALLDQYKKRKGDWGDYEAAFLDLMAKRRVETTLDRAELDGACLLCSEPTAEKCHRRLVAEYLARKWEDVEVLHL